MNVCVFFVYERTRAFNCFKKLLKKINCGFYDHNGRNEVFFAKIKIIWKTPPWKRVP